MQEKLLPVLEDDGWLAPYAQDIIDRTERYHEKLKYIDEHFNGIVSFSKQYLYLGFNKDDRGGFWYREWAPGANALSLVGDFNNWNKDAHVLHQLENGVWEIYLEPGVLKHESLVKVHVKTNMHELDRIPAYIQRTYQDSSTYDFSGQIWDPQHTFEWTHSSPGLTDEAPVIYECHVGMAQEKEGIGTYKEFEKNVLPRIKEGGYNCIQLMAIQEHPYYGSFGYHVSNFFAVSSRFGTPEELKSLINSAHKMGIRVLLDLVHSHAVKNTAEGLNEFDGSDDQYFHPGGRGTHEGWDSKLFNYGKNEVLQFLLSNISYWQNEFHFDGFRFDGVTSMLYFHHGEHVAFDHYDKYFKEGVEWDALIYLQLANTLAKLNNKNALLIAEDMSGMPGLCRQASDGGIGFDYRLGMGIPDYWIKTLKHTSDENWNIHEIWDVLNNRRYKEKTIAYAESHDQALVGDKTLAFWLMDKEMYFHMKKIDDHIVIERGLALHKMLRFITISLGGEGYLNFIGNEFGHPEWVDFPREGNNWSYKYARRQWSLVDDKELKYEFLKNFDTAMIHLIKEGEILSDSFATQLNMDALNKTIIFEKNAYVFVFNFHPHNSVADYQFIINNEGRYQVVFDSDAVEFGGQGRIDRSVKHHVYKNDNQESVLSIYIPQRTCQVLKKIE